MSWPMLLDLSRDDCKRILRRLELEGYSAVLSAFRAQGDLTKEKKKVLQDLQSMLSISTERHRAEVRRAVNDEKFATIAHNIAGSNSTSEWLIEGRRLIPLMPRLVPQTAFTVTANQVANAQAEKNAMLPFPKNTAGRDAGLPVYSASSSMSSVGTSTSKISRPSSPTSNVVVLPSGASIHIKGVLHPDEDEELQTRKRRRSQSSENINLSSVSTQTPRIAYSSTPQPSHNTMSPVKITISKSPQSRGISSTSHSQPPKVILVTSSGQSMTPTVLHKSVSVPIVRASTSTSTAIAGINRGSMMPISSPVTMSSASVVTVSSSSFTSPTSSVSTNSVLMGTSPVFHPSTTGKPRYRTIPRQRFPTQHKPGVVIPMSSQPVHPSPQSLPNIQVKTLTKPTIQIKQDGGMKIITQNIQGTTSKILPKPSHLSSPSSTGTPVVVVNTGSGSQTSKVLNISTPGGRVIATTKSNVVTVNPKAIQLTAVKTAGGTTVSKPNVIVVQKTQQRRPHTPTMISKSSSTVLANPTAFEKELVTFIQKQEGNPGVNISQSTSTLPSGKIGERKVIITTASTGASKLGGNLMPKNKAESEGRTSSLLAELIQAAGIVPTDAPLETSSGGVASSVGGNEWIEYDVTEEQAQALAASGSTDPATLQAILGLSSSQQHQDDMEEKPPDESREVIELQPEQQVSSQGNYFTLEQAMKLLEQSPSTTTSDIKSEQYTVTEPEKDLVNPTTTSPTVIFEQSLQLNLPQTEIIEERKVDTIKQIKPSPVQQFDGDLDPETGLFYTQSKPLTEEENSATSKSSADLDLIRSSLEEANINLDTFQYVVNPSENKEGSPSAKVADSQNEQFGVTVNLADEGQEDRSQNYKNDKGDIQQLETERKREVATVVVPVREMEELLSTSEQAENTTVPPVKFHSSQVTRTQSDTGVGDSNLDNVEADSSAVLVTMETSAGDALPEKLTSDIFPLSETTSNLITNASTELAYLPKTSTEEKDNVVILGMDSTPKNIVQSEDASEENFLHASQSSLGSSSDSQSEGDPLRISKRKRKHPITMDEVQTSVSSSPSQAGWVRSAAGLLLKVSKYRGLNREKGELNAAAWFTQPVDPADAPDYYSIVKNPMDFGTIRKKLESGMYKEFENFHSDMLLVKDNCFLYNPPTSPVRSDCTDVFNFYQTEADKLKEKWQKSHIGSPLSKKPRPENKSPSKS